MHADPVSKSHTPTFIPPVRSSLAARLQNKEAIHKTGDLSPLLGRQWSRPSKLQEKQQQTQAKYAGNPAAAFSGPGRSIPSQQKYSQLLGQDLSGVKLHMGPQVDTALHNNGLQGLTDGTQNIAVASTAEAGTLEHEITHIGQPTVTEGTRAALESHADRGAQQLMAGKVVEAFGGSSSSGAKSGSLQGKCSGCEEKKEKLQGKEYQSRGQPGNTRRHVPDHLLEDDKTADTGGVYLNFYPCCVPGGLVHHIGLSRANAAGNPIGSMGFYPMGNGASHPNAVMPGEGPGVPGHVMEDTTSHSYSVYVPSSQINTTAVMTALNTTRANCGSEDPESSLYCKYNVWGYSCGNYASQWLQAGGLNISGHFNPDSVALQVLRDVPGAVRRVS